MDEREAIARLRRGDLAGLELLVHTHQDEAKRTAYLITGDAALAEDIVQAAFLRAAERIHQFDSRRPFAPWFLRSVANDALRAATRRRRQLPLDGEARAAAEQLASPRPGPSELVEEAETREEMWAALSQLSPPLRAAVVLRYYLGLSEAEAAEQLDCAPGTIKSRLHAARRHLRQLLAALAPPRRNSRTGRGE
jgi:RNA polymerase sigma-70 factor (ECF subfamily)